MTSSRLSKRSSLAGERARRWVVGAWPLVLALGALACSSGLRDATSYSGQVAEKRVAPAGVQVLNALPPQARLLGRASAACDISGIVGDGPIWLSDLDCSTERLTRALSERAAGVGANVLAERRCNSEAGRIECTAAVAVLPFTSVQPVFGTGPNIPLSEAWLDEPQPQLAWRIAVRVARVAHGPTLHATPASTAQLLEHRSPVHAPVGDLLISCDASCPRSALRHAAEIAAARLGANVIAELRCSRVGTGQSCLAELGVDEETLARVSAPSHYSR